METNDALAAHACEKRAGPPLMMNDAAAGREIKSQRLESLSVTYRR